MFLSSNSSDSPSIYSLLSFLFFFEYLFANLPKISFLDNGNISSNVTGNLAGIYVSRGLNSYNTILLNNSVNNTGGLFLNMTNHAGNGIGSISQASETTVAFNTSSDYRLKENVDYTFDATTRLKQLKPARFNFISDDTNTLVDGFLAHEVSHDADGNPLVPDAIYGSKDAVEVWKANEELPDGVSVGDNKLDGDGNTIPDYQGIDQSKLVPLLTKALQEQQATIEALTARITALEEA